MLIDARAFCRDDALANDDAAESALEVLTLPVVGKITTRAPRSCARTHLLYVITQSCLPIVSGRIAFLLQQNLA